MKVWQLRREAIMLKKAHNLTSTGPGILALATSACNARHLRAGGPAGCAAQASVFVLLYQ
jgi:hypothetical protein